MKIFIFKTGSKLVPSTSEDKDKIAKLPAGEPFQIKYVEIRNIRHHRKYFQFIKTVFENLPEKYDNHWPDVETFRRSMQMYAGYYDETISLKGETHLQPKSIAFDKLDETAFSELHSKVKNIIGKHILPDMDMEVVEREIEQFY